MPSVAETSVPQPPLAGMAAVVTGAAGGIGQAIACELAAAIADVPGRKLDSLLDHPLGDGFSLQELLEDVQRHYLRRAMEEANGVKKRAAELLGIANYQTLDAQLKRLGVSVPKR